MNVTGSQDKNFVPQAPFSVGKKGELLFEGKAPKEVREVSSEAKGDRPNFSPSRRQYMEALAGELNTLYKASANGILEAKVSGKGFTAFIRVTVETPQAAPVRSNKENFTKKMLDHAKNALLHKAGGLTPKEILPRNDGSYEVTFEAKMHPGREIRQSFSADEITQLAKEWEKELPK